MFKQNPVLYNAIDSSSERAGKLSLSLTKSSLIWHSSSPVEALSWMTSDGQQIPKNGEKYAYMSILIMFVLSLNARYKSLVF